MPRPTMLAVDDDPEVLASIYRDLRSRYGGNYRIMRATSGQQALDVLAELALRSRPVVMVIFGPTDAGHDWGRDAGPGARTRSGRKVPTADRARDGRRRRAGEPARAPADRGAVRRPRGAARRHRGTQGRGGVVRRRRYAHRGRGPRPGPVRYSSAVRAPLRATGPAAIRAGELRARVAGVLQHRGRGAASAPHYDGSCAAADATANPTWVGWTEARTGATVIGLAAAVK